jgi:hypothetical protein
VATRTDYVGTVQDQFLENIRLTQQALVDGFEAWTQNVDRFIPDLSAPRSGGEVPNVEHVIDETFDLAVRLIEAQREFAKSIVGVVRETEDVAPPTAPEAKPKTTSPAASGPKGDHVAPSATSVAKPKSGSTGRSKS